MSGWRDFKDADSVRMSSCHSACFGYVIVSIKILHSWSAFLLAFILVLESVLVACDLELSLPLMLITC